MAKIVVAGCSDCPYFAKVELLADRIKINVPNFAVHKIVKTRKEWNAWASELSKTNSWNIKDSPIIWRELVDRGGKGHLIGGPNEFQEYIKCYYNVISDFTSQQMLDIADDNIIFKEDEDRENREFKALSTPVKVCIFGAANEAVPHFLLSLARGDVINANTELSIVFLDRATNLPVLKSLQMGTFDLACRLVRSISITDDAEAALVDSSIVVIFDEMVLTERPNEMDEGGAVQDAYVRDMRDVQDQYEYLGSTIDKCCLASVKVLVVPTSVRSCVNVALVCMHRMLTRVPRFNVVGLARPMEQRVRSVLARKLDVNASYVHNIVVWGNVGGGGGGSGGGLAFTDISNCRVQRYDGAVTGPDPFSLPVTKAIWDKKWLRTEMIAAIDKRVTDIAMLRSKPGSPLALGYAVSTFLHQWINGDDVGHVHSLAVAAEGSWYGVPEGLVFSMPVTLNPKGYWTVVQDIELSELQYMKIKECVEDISQKVQILYPWMNSSNAAGMAVDEAFIDGQINALLQEVYSKDEIPTIRLLINTLILDDKIEISRSKDLLIATVSDLQKPTKSNESIVEVVSLTESEVSAPQVFVSVENDAKDDDPQSDNENNNSENSASDRSKDDLLEEP